MKNNCLIIELPSELPKVTQALGIPIRTAYLSSILKKKKITHDILDLNIKSIEKYGTKLHQENIMLLTALNGLKFEMFKYYKHSSIKKYICWLRTELLIVKKYKYILFNGNNSFFYFNISRLVKTINPESVIIVGGDTCTDDPSKFINNISTDIIIRGYADNNLPDILKGISKNFEKITLNNKTILMSSLDFKIKKIETPDYSKINLKLYFKYIEYAYLISSFGCPHTCKFCSIKGESVNVKRKIEDTIAEINHFIIKYNIKYYEFTDPNFNLNKKYVEELCHAIIDNKLKIRWGAYFTINNLDSKFIQLLSIAGCRFIKIGIESTSNNELKKIGKINQSIKLSKIISEIKKNKILIRGSFMYDLPNEKFSSFLKSTIYALKNIDFFRFYRFGIYKGTEMYDELLDNSNYKIDTNLSLQLISSPKEYLNRKIKQTIASYLNKYSDKKIKKLNIMKHFDYKQ